MDALRDSAHIGMFEPHDIDILQSVFTRLRAANVLDDVRARSLARSIITLYRHGVCDPEQLFGVLQTEMT